MRRNVVIIAALIFSIYANAQADGRKNIENLCGCFEVKFKYAETFSPDPNYKYRERDDLSEGLELIVPLEMSDKKIVLQHLLLISDSMIIKHWREDWTYEEPELWTYSGDMRWTRLPNDPQRSKGKWTQSVWEVSDAPRYQGAGEWVSLDGKTFWQNTSDAPLPRREYTTRSDYNILKRTNKISLSENGWVHEQDNQKIIREQNSDKLLVEEKGFNIYTKTDASKCEAAKMYWEKHQEFWVKVRTAWKDIMKDKSSITVKTRVEGRPLYLHLDELEKDLAKASSKQSLNADAAEKIMQLLKKFVETR